MTIYSTEPGVTAMDPVAARTEVSRLRAEAEQWENEANSHTCPANDEDGSHSGCAARNAALLAAAAANRAAADALEDKAYRIEMVANGGWQSLPNLDQIPRLDGGRIGVGGGGGPGGWRDIIEPELGASFGKGEASVRLNLVDKSLLEYGFLGGAGTLAVGKVTAGIGTGMEDGHTYVGAFGEVKVLHGEIEGNLIGDDEWGVDGGVGATVGEAEAFIGYKDGSIGAELGVNLASVEGQVGANLGGHDVAVTGEIGFKLELGLSIGSHTEIKLGPVSVGFDIDW